MGFSSPSVKEIIKRWRAEVGGGWRGREGGREGGREEAAGHKREGANVSRRIFVRL